MLARHHTTKDVYINLFDFLKEEIKYQKENGKNLSLSSNLMPDLDFEKVALNKKQMLSEFIKCHSAFREEDEELEGDPSRSSKNR